MLPWFEPRPNFILDNYLPHQTLPQIIPSKNKRTEIRKVILELTNYNGNKNEIKQTLYALALDTCRATSKPKTIFDRLLSRSVINKFVIPAYSIFQDLIGRALKEEERRLQTIIRKYMANYQKNLLDNLLSTEKNYYEITLIQKDQKNFRYAEVQKIIEHKKNYQSLYELSKKLIPKFQITTTMVDYYASLIGHYPVSKLRKLPTYTTYLYLLCYIFRRIQKFNDNLMGSFVFYFDKYMKAAKEHAKQCIYESKLDLTQKVRENVPQVLGLFLEPAIADQHIRKKGFEIIPEEKFDLVIRYLSGVSLDEDAFEWAYYEEKKDEITKNLRPIFLSLDFKCSSNYNNLMKAIKFLKHHFKNKKPLTQVAVETFPLDFIPDSMESYVYGKDKKGNFNYFHLACYEFCVYSQIRKGFRNNEVTIQDSVSYKRLTDDLLPKHKRKKVIAELGNPLLTTPFKDAFHEDKKELDELYFKVNRRLENGENKSVRLDRQDNETRLILLYNKKEDLTNHDFFAKLFPRSIIDILNFSQEQTGFLNRFTHLKPHYAKAINDNQFILGVILANATHHGIVKMANVSNLDFQSLFNAEHNFVRLETLTLAANCLIEAISKLPIFSKWSILHDLLFAAVDGQRFQSRIDTLTARNSAKYFPLKKGIVAYTLLANFVPLSVKTIAPNLHESYFLFDIIKNMSADLNVNYISGDSHSINPVNFLLTRYLPTQFAPHLIHINEKIKQLCAFDHHSQFRDLIVKPHHQVKTNSILEEEENINWVIASLLQGAVSQSIIIRKLSSLARYDKTCKAMAEYNRVFSSIHTLNYINDPELRRHVRESLCRIEAYHQLRRAIALGNGGQFRGNSEIELSIWNECARLLALAILYYNARLLSAALKKYEATGDKETLEIIKRISPIAWMHINFLGSFEFSTNTASKIDIDRIVKETDFF